MIQRAEAGTGLPRQARSPLAWCEAIERASLEWPPVDHADGYSAYVNNIKFLADMLIGLHQL
jgi:hypothetical protein